ncbi:hypothetical protein GGH14_002451 [Coemansia sp. RSA 370]|nr:hypothetical protein GGH14_002451 [Coemansia sp. RSA 370]
MYATLMDERGERELNTLSDKKARTMTGSVVASLAHLKDIDGNDGAFFVFPDLSVRCEGVYRLKFSLFEIVGNQVFFCKSITSTMFTVYSAKKFPGMEESTRLTKLFAEQGLKIRVRKEQKTGRPKGARSRPIATALHSESGPPAPLSHISTWGDPRPHSSGSMTYPGMAGHPDHPQQQQQQPPPPAPYSAAPPNPWGSQHMQPTRGASGHAPSQSPQLRPIVTHYAPRPDMHHPHPDMHHPREPDSIGAQNHFRSQQHVASPVERSQFHGHYPPAGYPPQTASGMSTLAHRYQQHMAPGRPHHPLHNNGPFPPRMQGSTQTLPPMYESATAQPPGRHSPYAEASARSSGDYLENANPSIPYQSPPGYRHIRTPEDGMRQHQSHHTFGHQHRPWSPHHRAQQHYNPASSGQAFTSDTRYSPYNRMADMSRDNRQHVAQGVRVGMATSPANETQSAYPDHVQGRYYQLAPSQHQAHRMSSSTPETPAAGTDINMRAPPPYGPPLLGVDRQYAPPRQPLPHPQAVVRSPSPASATTSTSSCARQSGLLAPARFGPLSPPAQTQTLPPAPTQVLESPQRRIAVHSLLVSDSSSSPERPRRSP